MAREAVKDGVKHPELVKLSEIGNSGDQRQNSRRDLLRRFCKNMTVPRPLSMQVCMKDKLLQTAGHELQMLSPFDLVNSIWENHPNLFPSIFCTAKLEEFWSKVKPDDPRLQHMGDIMQIEHWQRKAIPFIVHGDGAPFNKKG